MNGLVEFSFHHYDNISVCLSIFKSFLLCYFTPIVYVFNQVDCSNSAVINTFTVAGKLSENAIIQKVWFTYIFLVYGSKVLFFSGGHFYIVFSFSFVEWDKTLDRRILSCLVPMFIQLDNAVWVAGWDISWSCTCVCVIFSLCWVFLLRLIAIRGAFDVFPFTCLTYWL